MAGNVFLVDRALGAMPIAKILDARTVLHVDGAIDKHAVTAADRPVLTGDQTLQPDALYPAETNRTLRYFLPRYRVSTDTANRPAVELRFKPGADDEVGRLSLTLTWTAPLAAGLEIRAMDHVAALTLRYRVPVESAAGSAAGPGWEHTMALQPLQQAGGLLARSTTIFRDKSVFDAVYQALRSDAQEATLDIQIRARVGIRTWRQVVVGRPTLVDQTKVLKSRGVLFTDMVHSESLANVRVVPIDSTAKIRIMTPATDVTSRVITTRAAVVQPAATSTPVAIDPALLGAVVAQPVTPFVMRSDTARMMTPIATRRAAPRVAAMTFRPDIAMRATVPLRAVGTTPAALSATVPVTPIAATVARPQITAASLARVNTPTLSQAVAVSDMKIAGRLAVPIQVALDTTKQPAVVDADLDNAQSLAFHFDPALPQHADVFAVEGFDSGGIHLLLALRLTGTGGATYVVYQDNLMRDVVHVAPSEFRLERDAAAPYLPAISFLASEFSTTEGTGADDADVLFRVTAVYRLEPWLDPAVVELARVELARQGLVARFTTTMAHDARLSLDLDLLGDSQQRADATVDPATGITDALDLDHNAFLRLWRERLSNPASGGVTGHVDYRLFDGSQAQVKVRLSLWEPSAELFDTTVLGPVDGQPGRFRVLIRNRIESPARITGLPADVVDGGIARAVNPGATIGQVLQPQEARQIDYDITGTLTDLSTFDVTVLAQAEPNLPALLKMLMLTPGYTSLGFSLTVKAADKSFGPNSGAEPVTGLLVEFDDGSRVTLSPALPQADVALVGRLIDQILGTAGDSQRYFYRVTNLHTSGEGARTGWFEGQGTAALEVGTAVARLDF